jgi:hypothetical protein
MGVVYKKFYLIHHDVDINDKITTHLDESDGRLGWDAV